MFHLPAGRHLRGAGVKLTEAEVQRRVAELQAQVAEYKSLADRRAKSIKALKFSIAAVTLALALAIGASVAPVRQVASGLVNALGLSHNAVNDVEVAERAYQAGDYRAALRLVQPLAQRGDGRAQTLLGLMNYHGRGLQKNDAQAATWFRRAADQGEPEGQFYVGVMYAEGNGVPQDYAEALKWYRLAAEQGEPRAQYNLGVSYSEGYGIGEDLVAAYMWFNLAASRFPASEAARLRAATNNRDVVARQMSREQIAEAQRMSVEWSRKHRQAARD